MDLQQLPHVIDPQTLQAHVSDPRLRIVAMATPEAYQAGHLPGALRLDYEDLVQPDPPVLGRLPDTAHLAAILGRLDLRPDSHVVAYDNEGGGRAARLLWTLDAMGHKRWSLLDGGLDAWSQQSLPLFTEPVPAAQAAFEPRPDTDAIATLTWLLQNLDTPELRLLDARSAGEYDGSDRRAARGGHIPGAVNLNWVELRRPAPDQRLRPAAELRALLAERDIRPEHDVAVYCQSHHRSALAYVVLRHLGYPRVRGYDGSWSEWGNHPETPVETGPRPAAD